MPVKVYKPTSPGRRGMSVSTFEEITRDEAERSLLRPLRSSGGRSHGRVAVRHRGGGNKRNYRLIDFKRDKHGVPGRVDSIEYDPNRSARIALLNYFDGERRYIVAPDGLKVGELVQSGPDAEIKLGNCLPLKNIPLGTSIHNVEMVPGRNSRVARSAGAFCQLMAKDGDYAQLRLPSGEVRMFHVNCRAVIGQVGNLDHENVSLGKAGRSRWLGKRPHVRGVAMNPVDHPLGGGEGKTSGGRHPVSPWGMPTRGFKTRNSKATDQFIIQRRPK